MRECGGEGLRIREDRDSHARPADDFIKRMRPVCGSLGASKALLAGAKETARAMLARATETGPALQAALAKTRDSSCSCRGCPRLTVHAPRAGEPEGWVSCDGGPRSFLGDVPPDELWKCSEFDNPDAEM